MVYSYDFIRNHHLRLRSGAAFHLIRMGVAVVVPLIFMMGKLAPLGRHTNRVVTLELPQLIIGGQQILCFSSKYNEI